MAQAALLLYAVWFAAAFGLRTLMQLRRTGDTGWRANGLPGKSGSIEWWAGLLFVLALLTGLAAPIIDLLGVEPLIGAGAVPVLGIAVAGIGIVLTFGAQVSMGDAWRIGVDKTERTELVSAGAFNLVRNPIFSAMFITATGLALMVPNVVALIGVATLLVALELQVRGAEEPHLRQLHGPRYLDYCTRVGRFIPGVGRQRDSTPASQ